MNVKNLSKIEVAQFSKNKNLLANIGIIILALVITRNIHLAQVLQINSLKEQIAKENEISDFIDDLKIIENRIDTLQKGFQVNLSTDRVIDRVSSLARRYNLKISSIDAQQSIDRQTFQLFPIKVKINTNYHRLGHLISDIENTGMLKVRSFTISNNERYYSDNPIESEVYLDLIAFSLKKN